MIPVLQLVLSGLLILMRMTAVHAQPPMPEAGRCDCPCSETCDPDILTPCEYDIIFTSFTHIDGPALDKKAKLFFIVDLLGLGSGYSTKHYNYFGSETGEGVTKAVGQMVHTVRINCGTTQSFQIKVDAIEKDAIGADDEGSVAIAIDLTCDDTSFLLQDYTATMDLNGKHDVQVNFQIRNKTPPCYTNPTSTCPNPPPPLDYDDTPKPCNMTLQAVGLTHFGSSTQLDSTGDFFVSITSEAPDGTSSGDSANVIVPVGSSKPLNMDTLFEWSIPCCEGADSCIEVPIKIFINEYDPFLNDAGMETSTITLCCPLKPGGEVYEYDIVLYGRNGKGKRRHEVRVTLVATTKSSNVCVIPPLPPKERPCTIQYTLIDIENVQSPKLDKNAEFFFEFTVGDEVVDLPWWMSHGVIHKGETVIANRELATVEIPCGERRAIPFLVEAVEWDRDLSIPYIVTIFENGDEYATTSDIFEVECRPDPEVVIRSYLLEFKNSNGNVRHKARIRVEQRLINWSLACECSVLDPIDSCDMEIALSSFEHDVTSAGDDSADFTFDFWFNSQVVSTTDSLRSVYIDNVDKGDVVTYAPDDFVDFGPPTNLLGTYYNNFIRIPVGTVISVRVDVYGEEYTWGADENGYATTLLKLFCTNEKQEYVLPITLSRRNKKVKHTGTLILVVGPA